MKLQALDWVWLDARETIGLADLAQVSGLSPDDLVELVEYGALQPLTAEPSEQTFSAACVSALRTAVRLRQDFDLDLFAVAVVLDYVRKVEVLERRIESMQARWPG